MRTELKKTADGSHTLFVPQLDEHYHSVNGAIQESNHIFIKTGFQAKAELKNLHIFEVGFGTGLNAFLTLKAGLESNQKIQYTSIEVYPVDMAVVEDLNYAKKADSEKFLKLHQASWGEPVEINENFSLHKIEADLTKFDFSRLKDIDLVYFDAFAPEKQEEMWSEAIFTGIYNVMNEGSVLVTYCAKGVIRRQFQKIGFSVERLEGPPGKREILRARK